MKKFFIATLFASLALKAAPAPKIDTLNIGMGAEFENLNPAIGNQAATKYMLYLAHRPLVILTQDLEWKPLLIKEFPTLKNKMVKVQGDSMEVTLELLANLQWGDGVPVTCKDLELGWKVGKTKTVSIPNREPFENITSITADAANNKKCKITYAKKKFDYFTSFPDLIPEHLEGPILEKFKDKAQGYDQNSLYTKQPTNPGLYFGPYVISEVKLGSHVIFVPNPKFGGEKPHFKKIVVKLIPNTGTLEANLRSQNINMVSAAAGFSLDQAVIFDKKVKTESLPHQVIFEDGVVYAHMDLNLSNPILADIKVRKALSHGFNKKEMVNSLLEGRAVPANQPVTAKDPWYVSSGIAQYDFSRRTAAKLLDEAGWKVGPDGIRVKDGKKMALTVISAAGVKLNENILAFIQEQYKALGIQLSIKAEPARVFFGDTVNHRKFDMALYSWVSIPESSPRSILHSVSIPSQENSWAGQNYTGYKNAQMDKWIDELESEMDSAKRASIGKKIMQRYAEDIPVIPLYYRANNSVVPKGMKNYRLSGHQFYETLYVEKWTF